MAGMHSAVALTHRAYAVAADSISWLAWAVAKVEEEAGVGSSRVGRPVDREEDALVDFARRVASTVLAQPKRLSRGIIRG